jgi:hypothetical protein
VKITNFNPDLGFNVATGLTTGGTASGGGPHAASHQEGGGDTLEVADLATAETDDTLVLAPDGAGGVEFRAETGGGGGSGLLAVNQYAPTSQTVYSSSGTAMQDVDATNMAVTFTAPASGNVLVRLNAFTDSNSAAGDMFWGLRESTTDLPGIARLLRGANDEGYNSVAFYLTGISGGSHTYKWAFGASSGTVRIIIQDGSAIGEWGPGIMEVWSAP